MMKTLYRIFQIIVITTFTLVCAIAQTPQPATPVPKPAPVNTPIPPPPSISGKHYVLMDYPTGQFLAENAADDRVEPASITKVMTSYVISAEIAAGKIKMDDEVFISENAWRSGGGGTEGSTSFLAVNSKVPLKDLLYGMIIQSGNDAAIALAEHAAGSENTFANLMNQYAIKIGLKNTHFVNSTGLPDPDHYTTARDIAVLSRALIHDFPEDYKIYALKDFEWNGIKQHNRNTLLWRDPTVDGIKTGHTKTAGFCLATSAKRNEQRLIAIVMNAPSEKSRADDNQSLLNYGFRFFESHKIYDAGKMLVERPLWKSSVDKLPIGIKEELSLTLPRGRYKDLSASLELPGQLIAPFSKDQAVGKLKIILDDKILIERPLIVLNDAPLGGLWRRFSDSVMLWFKDDAKTEVSAVPSPQ